MKADSASERKLVVIGGGISGLSAAYYALQNAARQGLRLQVALVESGSHWGGKITTDRVGGFVVEGGPDTFLASKPWGVGLCKELGLGDRLVGTNPELRNTYVLHRERLVPLPDGLAMMIPTNFASMARTSLLSWRAKARMGLDFVLPPRGRDGDESLGEFVSRRLGRPAYENLIEPLMSGIYAGDGDQLSLGATFPYLRDMEVEHGGLIRGALAAKKKMAQNRRPASGSRSAFLTPITGLAEIVEALVAFLQRSGVDLRLNTAARSIQRLKSGYGVSLDAGCLLEAEAVVLAAPAFASAALLRDLDPRLAAEMDGIPYTSTATVSLAYLQSDLPRPLDGYGYVIPRREGRRALAVTWTSTKFPHRAPPGSALLRVFIGRAGQEAQIAWREEDLLEIAQEELALTLGITARPLLNRVFIWEKAMPQYNLGHPERMRRIQERLSRFPGIALAGNGYQGIGIPDCIHSGELAAQAVIAV